MAGGTALNCVANSRIWRETAFDEVWVQPAAGDAGTALGAALAVGAEHSEPATVDDHRRARPVLARRRARGLAAGRRRPVQHPRRISPSRSRTCSPPTGWSPGSTGAANSDPARSGYRSLLAHPGRAENLERLNDVKGREQFRPVAPMVLLEDADTIFSGGPIPSPYMLFVHDVKPDWQERIPAAVHVDGTARIQTVDPRTQPRLGAMIESSAAAPDYRW